MQEKSDFEIENPNILKNIRHQNAEVGFSGAKVGLSKKKLDIRLSKKIRLPTTEDFKRKKVGLPFSKRKRQILKMINLTWKKERTFSRRRRTSDFENEKSDSGKKYISNEKSDFQNKKVGF